MRSPRSKSDTFGLRYTKTEEGESPKSGKERSNKGNKAKPTCHNCGKIGHTTSVCRSKTASQNPNRNSWVIAINETNKEIRHKNSKPRP